MGDWRLALLLFCVTQESILDFDDLEILVVNHGSDEVLLESSKEDSTAKLNNELNKVCSYFGRCHSRVTCRVTVVLLCAHPYTIPISILSSCLFLSNQTLLFNVAQGLELWSLCKVFVFWRLRFWMLSSRLSIKGRSQMQLLPTAF